MKCCSSGRPHSELWAVVVDRPIAGRRSRATQGDARRVWESSVDMFGAIGEDDDFKATNTQFGHPAGTRNVSPYGLLSARLVDEKQPAPNVMRRKLEGTPSGGKTDKAPVRRYRQRTLGQGSRDENDFQDTSSLDPTLLADARAKPLRAIHPAATSLSSHSDDGRPALATEVVHLAAAKESGCLRPNDAACNELKELLERTQSAHLYVKFTEANATSLEAVRFMTNNDLLRIGVDSVGMRKRILVELTARYPERRDRGVSLSTHDLAGRSTLKSMARTDSERAEAPSASAIASHRAENNEENAFSHANEDAAGEEPDVPPAAPSKHALRLFPIFEKRRKGCAMADKPQQRANKRPRKSLWERTSTSHSFRSLVPGTTFTVDSFRCSIGNCRQFFLSHFHADHYGGLRKSFAAGIILCSDVTAKLVMSRLGVRSQCVQVVPMRQETFVPDLGVGVDRKHENGALVTLLDANHCPGSVMFLFKVKSTGKSVLHCGDCRYDADVIGAEPSLTALVEGAGLDHLYLDTTYCDPRYVFPPQKAVIRAVIDIVRAESYNSKTLFMFGSYQIGKERLYLKAAETLKMKVFVEPYKERILKCLNLPAAVSALITSSAQDARIHVGPMSLASVKGAMARLRQSRGRFSNAVAFRPTGWSWSGPAGGSNGLVRKQRANVVLYEVAYSEHSSFTELKSFVRLCRPRKLTPTVNCRSAADITRLAGLLDHRDQ